MASYHCAVKIIGRGKGRSATAAAAYRSGSKMRARSAVAAAAYRSAERFQDAEGQWHDYSHKEGVLHTEILAPENAPQWMKDDRQALWLAVEKVEKRKDAQLAREVELALPRELSHDQRVELVRQFVGEQFVSRGMIADVAMHNPSKEEVDEAGNTHTISDHNPHAHVMLTTRNLLGEGFGPKNTEWNDWSNVPTWRTQWADLQNQYLERVGAEERVDHRTLEDQGIDRLPQIKMGTAVNDMEERGIATERGNRQLRIALHNQEIERAGAEDRVDHGSREEQAAEPQSEASAHTGTLDTDHVLRVPQVDMGPAVDDIKEHAPDTDDELPTEHGNLGLRLVTQNRMVEHTRITEVERTWQETITTEDKNMAEDKVELDDRPVDRFNLHMRQKEEQTVQETSGHREHTVDSLSERWGHQGQSSLEKLTGRDTQMSGEAFRNRPLEPDKPVLDNAEAQARVATEHAREPELSVHEKYGPGSSHNEQVQEQVKATEPAKPVASQFGPLPGDNDPQQQEAPAQGQENRLEQFSNEIYDERPLMQRMIQDSARMIGEGPKPWVRNMGAAMSRGGGAEELSAPEKVGNTTREQTTNMFDKYGPGNGHAAQEMAQERNVSNEAWQKYGPGNGHAGQEQERMQERERAAER